MAGVNGNDGSYLIKKGDNLSKIAKKYGVTVKQLQEANGIKNANLIFEGKTLKIPGKSLSDEDMKVDGLYVRRDETPKPNQPETFVNFDDGAVADAKTKPDASKLSDEDMQALLKDFKEKLPSLKLEHKKLTDEEIKEIIAKIRERANETTKAMGEEGGSSVTYAIGEGGGMETTKAMNEEGGSSVTYAIGEGGGMETTKAMNEEGGSSVTYAIGESGGMETTKAMNEEGGGSRVTTMALGEEGGSYTTQALNEEGGSSVTYAIGEGGGMETTKAMNEEGGGSRVTTMALGEEGGSYTTQALNEEGGGISHLPKLTDEEFEKIKKMIEEILKKRENPIETTKSIGEEGGSARITTMALGEEGGSYTTQALNEEGGSSVTYAVGEGGGMETTKAMNEEGGGSRMTTMALGEEGGTFTPIGKKDSELIKKWLENLKQHPNWINTTKKGGIEFSPAIISTGEFKSLTPEQKNEIIQAWKQQTGFKAE